MKILKSVSTETVHTIEITEKELNTLIIGFGHSANYERVSTAKGYKVPILEGQEAHDFYSDLHDKHLTTK